MESKHIKLEEIDRLRLENIRLKRAQLQDALMKLQEEERGALQVVGDREGKTLEELDGWILNLEQGALFAPVPVPAAEEASEKVGQIGQG